MRKFLNSVLGGNEAEARAQLQQQQLARTPSRAQVPESAESDIDLGMPGALVRTGTDNVVVPIQPGSLQTPSSFDQVSDPGIESVTGTTATPGRPAESAVVLVNAPASSGLGVSTTTAVASESAIVAALGQPLHGMLTGVVAQDLAQQCVLLDLGCAHVAVVITQEAYATAHWTAVRNRVERNWLYKIGHVLVAPPDVVAAIYLQCLTIATRDESAQVSFDTRFIRTYDHIVEAAVLAGASDIHFETVRNQGFVRLRVHGRMRPWLDLQPDLVTHLIGAAFGQRSKTATATKEQFSAQVPIAFMTSQDVGGRQFEGRYNGRPHATGYKGVMRLLESTLRLESIPRLQDLGYSKSQVNLLEQALNRQWGLIIIFGSTGSGKSTTLRTMMVHLPGGEEVIRYSCESPVEYEMPGVVQFSLPVDVNMDSSEMAARYTAMLRDAMRMDPDVLMQGEIRDHESGSLAVEFTTSGHRCFTTVHGEGCIDGLGRLAGGEIRMPPDTLAGSKFLNAGIYQKLLPILCPHCRIPALKGLAKGKRETLARKYQLDAGTMYVAKEDGCQQCRPKVPGLKANGTVGATVAAEIFIPTPEMHAQIAQRNWPAVLRLWRGQRRVGYGDADMRGKTAFEHGLWLAAQGTVSIHDIESQFEPIETYELHHIEAVDGQASGAIA